MSGLTMPTLPARYDPPTDLLKDRVVLVTGAGSGLGRALALACGRVGATVLLSGRKVPQLESVYDEIRAGGGAEPVIHPLDLAAATWADYERLAEALQREFGRLDGLAHCAAHFRNFAPLAQFEPRDWLETLQVNLTSAFALTRLCLPLLEQSGGGSIVLLSDECGRRGRAYAGAYGVSKFGLEGLMQTWAQELESAGRVRINTLDPGPMDTALRRKGFSGGAAAPPPETATPALLWLLGPDSRPASGQAFSLRQTG